LSLAAPSFSSSRRESRSVSRRLLGSSTTTRRHSICRRHSTCRRPSICLRWQPAGRRRRSGLGAWPAVDPVSCGRGSPFFPHCRRVNS
jgi:hypothetical protein